MSAADVLWTPKHLTPMSVPHLYTMSDLYRDLFSEIECLRCRETHVLNNVVVLARLAAVRAFVVMSRHHQPVIVSTKVFDVTPE
jgi:hypothetical protein